ncbi:hypothetical protein BZL30_9116 [Mycobacterium kansasii]|uniref:Uncharacterized protein n=1 Tax=Mycobacterium kansasii TaxID=1768 RepID=A0A1V3WCF6_MYCKA|nr:hypothetical protein BZL30_9116 [Mycobacterium kansasii]
MVVDPAAAAPAALIAEPIFTAFVAADTIISGAAIKCVIARPPLTIPAFSKG